MFKLRKVIHLLCINVIALSTLSIHADKEELLSMSFEELLAIPVDRPYEGVGIFQSDEFKSSPQSLNIGLLVPLTSWPRYSAQLIIAADFAVEHVNKSGGVNGKPLAVLRADTDHTANHSSFFAQELVTNHRAQALIGPVTSDEANNVLTNVNVQSNVPMFSYAASANSLSERWGGKLFWRLYASNERQVRAIAKQLSQLNPKRVQIISTTDLYGKEMTAGLKENLPNTKINVWTFSSKVDPKVFNIEEKAKEIQHFVPDAIILLTKATLSEKLLDKLLQSWKGVFPPVFTGDNLQLYDLSDALLANQSLCISTLITKRKLAPKFENSIRTITQMEAKDLDAAYVFDSVILFAMAKQLEDQLKVNFATAVKLLTGNGQVIQYEQYAEVVELVKKHKQLSYVGVGGQITFNSKGNNISSQLTTQRSGSGCI